MCGSSSRGVERTSAGRLLKGHSVAIVDNMYYLLIVSESVGFIMFWVMVVIC